MIQNWHKYQQLTSSERWQILCTIGLIGAMKLGLRSPGFNRLMRLLLKFATADIAHAPDRSAAVEHARHTERVIAIAARYGPFSPSCLERSLLLWWLLRRAEIDSQLRIGVRKEPGRFVAHAWVEYDRMVLNDRPDVGTHYAAFEGAIDIGGNAFR